MSEALSTVDEGSRTAQERGQKGPEGEPAPTDSSREERASAPATQESGPRLRAGGSDFTPAPGEEPPTWDEVLLDEGFQKLEPETKDKVKRDYYHAVVANRAPEEKKDEAWRQFVGYRPDHKPPERGFWDKTWDVAESAALGVANFELGGGNPKGPEGEAPEGGGDSFGAAARKTVENAPDLWARQLSGLVQGAAETNPASGVGFYGTGTTPPDQRRRDVIKKARQQFDEAAEEIERNAPELQKRSPEWYGVKALESGINMVPAVLTSLAGSPGAGASLIGGQVFGDSYAHARREGMSPSAAAGKGVADALAESLAERIPLGVLSRAGKSTLSRIFKGAAAEGIQEPITQAAQTLIDAGFDPETTIQDAVRDPESWRQLGDALIIGPMVGGGLATATEPLVAAQRSQAGAQDGTQEGGWHPPLRRPEPDADGDSAAKGSQDVENRHDAPKTKAGSGQESNGRPFNPADEIGSDLDGGDRAASAPDADAGQAPAREKTDREQQLEADLAEAESDTARSIIEEELTAEREAADKAEAERQKQEAKAVEEQRVARERAELGRLAERAEARGDTDLAKRMRERMETLAPAAEETADSTGQAEAEGDAGQDEGAVESALEENRRQRRERLKQLNAEWESADSLKARAAKPSDEQIQDPEFVWSEENDPEEIMKGAASAYDEGTITAEELDAIADRAERMAEARRNVPSPSGDLPTRSSSDKVMRDLNAERDRLLASTRERAEQTATNEQGVDAQPAEAQTEQAPASAPTMVTQRMKRQLRDKGYSDDAIKKMKPREAWDAINAQESDAGADTEAGEAGEAEGLPTQRLRGKEIDQGWAKFAPEADSLGIPRAQMPQVKAEDRGALVNFLKARDVESTQEEVDPSTLRPTQAEFSQEKVDKAKARTGGDRSILVSRDGRVIDGHHQWLAKLDQGEPIAVTRLSADADQILPLAAEFPSSERDEGGAQSEPEQAPASEDAELSGALEALSASDVMGVARNLDLPNRIKKRDNIQNILDSRSAADVRRALGMPEVAAPEAEPEAPPQTPSAPEAQPEQQAAEAPDQGASSLGQEEATDSRPVEGADIARAADIDEAAVVNAATQFENDYAGFSAAIRRILDDARESGAANREDATQETNADTEGDSGGASSANARAESEPAGGGRADSGQQTRSSVGRQDGVGSGVSAREQGDEDASTQEPPRVQVPDVDAAPGEPLRELEAAVREDAARTGRDASTLEEGSFQAAEPPAWLREFGRAVERAFGKRVVFFRPAETAEGAAYNFDGVVLDSGALYVRVDAARPHRKVVFHELFHALRRSDPELYDALVRALDRGDFAQFDYANATANQRTPQGLLLEEMLADTFAQEADNPEFWASIGDQLEPGMLQRFVDMVRDVLDRMRQALDGRNRDMRQYIDDYDAVAATMQEYTRKYLERNRADADASAFSRRDGPAEKVGGYTTRTAPDGSFLVEGEPEEVRTVTGLKGRAVNDGVRYTATQADQARRALEGDPEAFGRQGRVTRHPRYQGGSRAGQYIGAPEQFNTPAKVPRLRRLFKQLASEGEPGRHWYERSGRAVLEMTNYNRKEAEKLVKLLAIYSPQAKVGANTTFALKAWAQYKAGEPIQVKTGNQDEQATAVLYEGKDWGGEKTNNFYRNLMREVNAVQFNKHKQGVTVDLWMMRAAGYDADAPTAAAYRFVETETNRLAEELGWEPQQVQAAIWVAMKARTENDGVKKRARERSVRTKAAEYVETTDENGKKKTKFTVRDAKKHRRNWLDEALKLQVAEQDTLGAKFDYSDGLRRHLAQVAWEARPGRSTGLLPGVHDAPYRQQAEFQEAIARVFMDPKTGDDLLAQRVGLLADGRINGPGAWEMDVSAGSQNQLIVPPAGGDAGGGKVSPAARKLVNLYADMMGLYLRQEGVAWHRPYYQSTLKNANGVQLDLGRPLSPDEMEAFYYALDEVMQAQFGENVDKATGLVTYANGLRVINHGTLEGRFREYHKAVKSVASETLPTVEAGIFSSDGELRENDWKRNPDGQGYRQRIAAAGRPDLLRWGDDVLAGAIRTVYRDFAGRYGWGNPSFSRQAPQEEGADGRGDPADGRRGSGAQAEDRRAEQEARPDADGSADVAPEAGRTDYGRGFTDFFDQVTRGLAGKSDTGKAYEPVIPSLRDAFSRPGSTASEFAVEYAKHRGNFDDHIAMSIPGHREVQMAVGDAIRRTFEGQARVLDIGASEGSFIKAISALTDGRIQTTGVDFNPGMTKHFNEHSQVEGSDYQEAAFVASPVEEGQLLWTEDDGQEVYGFRPNGPYDVVHESMVFQFIKGEAGANRARESQIARVHELTAEDGLAIIEEKIVADDGQENLRRETQKDGYKAQYFTPGEMERKRQEVLQRGGDEAEGMNDLMVRESRLEQILGAQFDHVHQYWDSGNFKGYVVSDNADTISRFLDNLADLNSEYSTQRTPRRVPAFSRQAPPEAPPQSGASSLGHRDRVEDAGNTATANLPETEGAETPLLPSTYEPGRILDDRGEPYAPALKNGILSGYPITRQEADELQADPGVRVFRLSTLGPDTTGQQGWFVDANRIKPQTNAGWRIANAAKRRERVSFGSDVLMNEPGQPTPRRLWKRVDTPGAEETPRTSTGQPLFSRRAGGDNPAFYSALTRAIENAKQNKAPAEQWKGIIDNLPGVKQEEIEWSGVKQWLDNQEGSVTREALADFLRQNEVQVEEVTLGEGFTDPDDYDPSLRMLDRETDDDGITTIEVEDDDSGEQFTITVDEDAGNVYVQGTGGTFIDVDAPMNRQSEQDAIEAIEKHLRDRYARNTADSGIAGDTHYEGYQTPGGKNYRELLLTLPAKTVLPDGWSVQQTPTGRWGAYAPEGYRLNDTYDTEAEAESAARRQVPAAKVAGFQSDHFDQPNILAHVRFNERTDADGNRVLFIEEVQSDWHQQGRKLGYDTPATRREIAQREQERQRAADAFSRVERDIRQRGQEVIEQAGPSREDAELAAQAADLRSLAERTGQREALDAVDTPLARQAPESEGGLPPDAPLKQSWPMLAMKRMIRYATENGFDRIAWTTGDQQADRYDLSQQVDGVRVFAPNSRGNYVVQIRPKRERDYENLPEGQRNVSREQLPSVIGKELADKALAEIDAGGDLATFEGVDLKVGGEGMRAFYDRELRNEVGKYVKKWGARVGTTEIPKAREVENKLHLTREFHSAEAWSIPVTDKMREAALEGQPMFSRRAPEDQDPFFRENERLREKNRSLWDRAKKTLRRQLMPGGLLPDDVFNAKIDRDSQFEVVEFDVRHLLGVFERTVKKAWGKTVGQLGESQQRRLQDSLAGELDETLPKSVQEAVVAMRQYIDRLSREYLDVLQGEVDMLRASEDPAAEEKAQLMETIASNLGRYVHRSYRAFDDPEWYREVPTDTLEAARRYLTQRQMSQGETPAEAARLAEVVLHEILKNGTAYESMQGFIKESKLGAKDLSVLKQRREIAPEIRALLGEYVDPRLNFAKSATKMGRLIWNQRFLQRVRDDGMGVFLFEGTDRPPEATAQIAADASEVFAPLNGLWTFPDVDQAFRDALGKEQMADWYRTIVQLNGAVKFGKTVLSPTTAARNWQSAFFFTLANGHFDMSHMSKSVSGLREYFKQQGKDERIRYLRRLKQLGVIYDTPYAGEMMRLLDDSKIEETLLAGRSQMAVKDALNMAQKFYQFGDDFWKIIGYENERRLLEQYGTPPEQAETEAAERIRNTYPTYSMTGRAVNTLRRFPLAGTFVSFPAEIVRTSVNMARYTAKDYATPGRRPLAIRRALGLAMAGGFAHGIQSLTKAWFDIDDEDEEAVRELGAPWNRNSNFLFTGRDEEGRLKYFDMSFLDPYNYWKRPINAILRGEPWTETGYEVLRELLTPFFGTDILAGALFEVVSNKRMGTGSEIWKEHDLPHRQVIDMVDHIRKAAQPGISSNLERTWKALEGEYSPSGKKYDLQDEAVSWIGWRASTLDPKVALYYKSFDFNDALSDAQSSLYEILRSPNEVSPEEIEREYERTLRLRADAFDEMQDIVGAARNAGMGRRDIQSALRSAGVSQENAYHLVQGTVPTWQPSQAAMRGADQKARALFSPKKAREILERFRQVPQAGSQDTP